MRGADGVCSECASPPEAYHARLCSQFKGYHCDRCGRTYDGDYCSACPVPWLEPPRRNLTMSSDEGACLMYAVNYSPLSGNIYAGRVNKAESAFTSKDDCTIEALVAAALHVIEQHGGELELTSRTVGPKLVIRAERA